MGDSNEFCILAVDDDRFNLRVMTDILKTNYAVITAGCGEDALKLAQEKQAGCEQNRRGHPLQCRKTRGSLQG